MRFPVLAVLLIFIAVMTYKLRSSERIAQKSSKEFWEKESRANNTRKQSLDTLTYIEIPLERLPMDDCSDETIQKCQARIRKLAEEKIVNLTGVTNTELKLTYGVSNLELLTSYDQNCTDLLRTLCQWGEALLANGQIAEAKTVLEYGVACKTDISKHYTLLAEIYKTENSPRKIEDLIQLAQGLPSISKNSITRTLKEISESCHAHE